MIIDVSPVGALTFGTDINDEVTLELDALLTPIRRKSPVASIMMMEGRKALYNALDQLDRLRTGTAARL